MLVKQMKVTLIELNKNKLKVLYSIVNSDFFRVLFFNEWARNFALEIKWRKWITMQRRNQEINLKNFHVGHK